MSIWSYLLWYLSANGVATLLLYYIPITIGKFRIQHNFDPQKHNLIIPHSMQSRLVEATMDEFRNDDTPVVPIIICTLLNLLFLLPSMIIVPLNCIGRKCIKRFAFTKEERVKIALGLDNNTNTPGEDSTLYNTVNRKIVYNYDTMRRKK